MTFPKSKKAPKKLTAASVKIFFNQAIVRRDKRCIITGREESLQCSHFFAVGGSDALRFYPPNAHAMTAGTHLDFHNRNVLPYTEWMQEHEDLEWMALARTKSIRYNQVVLNMIKTLCRDDELDILTGYIEDLIGG